MRIGQQQSACDMNTNTVEGSGRICKINRREGGISEIKPKGGSIKIMIMIVYKQRKREKSICIKVK